MIKEIMVAQNLTIDDVTQELTELINEKVNLVIRGIGICPVAHGL